MSKHDLSQIICARVLATAEAAFLPALPTLGRYHDHLVANLPLSRSL
jgi:hypothetical protein